METDDIYSRETRSRAETAGYRAHKEGKPLAANPELNVESYKDWEHGWQCRQEGIVPWAIHKAYVTSHPGPHSFWLPIELGDSVV